MTGIYDFVITVLCVVDGVATSLFLSFHFASFSLVSSRFCWISILLDIIFDEYYVPFA